MPPRGLIPRTRIKPWLRKVLQGKGPAKLNMLQKGNGHTLAKLLPSQILITLCRIWKIFVSAVISTTLIFNNEGSRAAITRSFQTFSPR